MDAMAAQLRQDYAEKETEELIELGSKTTLTATAYAVLDEILVSRGVDLESVRSLRARNAEQEKQEEESASNLASIPRRLAAKLIDTWGVILLIGIPATTLQDDMPELAAGFKAVFLLVFWAYFLFSDGWAKVSESGS